jgi:hypothetical protein
MKGFRTIVSASVLFSMLLAQPSMAEDVPRPDVSFPSFDYEVSCYEGFQSLTFGMCKKHEENARDFILPIWDKFLPKGRESCIAYAKQSGRGSYRKLVECAAYSLLLSFKNGALVRGPESASNPPESFIINDLR